MEDNTCKINNIKSNYILQNILLKLNKNQKLDIIIYNKALQKRLRLNIEDYKEQSRRYKIGEKNGYSKEYNLYNDNLLFEGEYKNGKKNGKGKEYYENGKIKFEGVYLNGKKIEGKGYNYEGEIFLIIEKGGKGKEYYDDKLLKFEGEYLNGKRWNGKGYNKNGKQVYEIKNGSGYIIEYDNDGDILFEGDYINGERNGKGKEYYSSNDYLIEYLYKERIRNSQLNLIKITRKYIMEKKNNNKLEKNNRLQKK